MFNSNTKSFFDIPSFHEMLANNGYNDIVVPKRKTIKRFYDNTSETIVDIDISENPHFISPSSYKFLKVTIIDSDEYKEAIEKQQSIYLSVSSLFYEMQKTVFSNCISAENFKLSQDVIDKLFDFVYSNAYDAGHSAGYDEVNCLLNSETNKCIEYMKVVLNK